jgi:hypothetical protein
MKTLIICMLVPFVLSCIGNVRPGLCRHNALYAATVYGEGHRVKIAFGPAKNSSMWHAQAKAKIDDKWEWLKTGGGKVWVGDQENFDPLNECTVGQFVEFMGWSSNIP